MKTNNFEEKFFAAVVRMRVCQKRYVKSKLDYIHKAAVQSEADVDALVKERRSRTAEETGQEAELF